MTTVISVDDRTFAAEVLKSSLPVLVMFWANWSGPSKVLLPKLDDIAEGYSDRLKVATVALHEVVTTQTTRLTYNIRSVPTYMVFKAGQATGTLAQAATQDQLIQLVGF